MCDVLMFMFQAGTEGGCVVLFDITSDGIVYNRSFANLDGKHTLTSNVE